MVKSIGREGMILVSLERGDRGFLNGEYIERIRWVLIEGGRTEAECIGFFGTEDFLFTGARFRKEFDSSEKESRFRKGASIHSNLDPIKMFRGRIRMLPTPTISNPSPFLDSEQCPWSYRHFRQNLYF